MQPKYNLATERICGAEALVRWNHPIKGILLPEDFFAAYEESGLMVQLDHFVWEKACQILHDWMSAGRPFSPVSINISHQSLFSPQLVSFLVGLISRYGISPSALQLEITESAYLENPEQVEEAVQSLHNVGFSIIMDGFGSGVSSLNNLKRLKCDALKLDIQYLPIKDTTENDEIMLVSLIKMSNWLGMTVIAEGVENRRQRDFLEGAGCDCAQGTYFCEPLPRSQYEAKYINPTKNMTEAQSPEEGQIEPKYNMTILVIDDEALSRELLKHIFSGLYHIHTCESAEMGLEYLKQNANKVKLILIDNFMPGMSGLEFLRYCKQDSILHVIPQIMITTSDDDMDQIKAFHEDAYDYITKPFTREIVLARVNHVMEISCRTSIFDIIEQKYKQKPELDAATALLNKMAFKDLASRVLETFPQEQQVLFVIDIDDFKKVNDKHGHLLGDKVIRCIADELTNAFRKTDIVGRFGGDEFVVLMTKIQGKDIAKIKAAEVIKSVLFNCAKLFNIHTSISIGLALSEENDSLDSLFSRADEALYEAKRTGKGKYIVSGETVPPIADDDTPLVVVCSEDVQIYETIALTYGEGESFAQACSLEELVNIFTRYSGRVRVLCLDMINGVFRCSKEAYQYILEQGGGKTIPLLAISSEGDMQNLREALKLDIYDILMLPPQLGVIGRILSRTIMEVNEHMNDKP